MTGSELALLARTARHLRAGQVVHRARLRGQRLLVRGAPGLARAVLSGRAPADAGWPGQFQPLDARLRGWPDAVELASGRVTLLGVRGALRDWRHREKPQLWRYHLHYWDWAWALTQGVPPDDARRLFGDLFRSWCAGTRFGQWDEWSPYVAALRAWSWCGQYAPLVRGTEIDDDFRAQLALHAGFLRRHLERDVGGNHLVKDLKALIGLGVFLRDEALLGRAVSLLGRELRVQVLADGGHYERSPAYHCQVLGDLIDVDALLAAATSAVPEELSRAVSEMRRWLGLVVAPDGSLPPLNDGFPMRADLLAALEPGPAAPDGLTLLADTGLGIMRRGGLHVIADVGLPCPDELPAHAHADTLGFLLYDGDTCVVGECGTSTYEAGARRAYERGTAAHSTVEVDGANSTEVWGTFRAARRARPTSVTAVDRDGRSVLSASHDGYARLPGRPIHARTWSLTAVGLVVDDAISGSGVHDVRTHVHLAPGITWTPGGGVGRLRVGSLTPLTAEQMEAARGWHELVPAVVLTSRVRASLPWRGRIEFAAEDAA
ncbi:MAG: heparinase II/III family protein [Mycobacteriales bacterium]|nr:heparinase II/III family protein [Frankia sp.]MCA1833590.1 heparinase II/III family protein [Actinomycetota bacterium]